METTSSVFIIGCGDIGRRVAALHLERGDRVSALSRSAASATRLEAQGIATVYGDLDDPCSLETLSLDSALVYYFAPPHGDSGADQRMESFIGTRHVPRKIIYLSTSGVYGDCRGAWIDEDTPPNPQTPRAQARLAAETLLTEWSACSGTPVVILRVGGIYGPDRLPLEKIQQGLPVLREDECPYTNRIHADDLARVCLAAAERGKTGAIYNVCDGAPSTMTDYFYAVADRFGLSRPPALSWIEAQQVLSAGMLSYLNESRRMDNRRMRKELGVTLLYPNLQAGLAASI